MFGTVGGDFPPEMSFSKRFRMEPILEKNEEIRKRNEEKRFTL